MSKEVISELPKLKQADFFQLVDSQLSMRQRIKIALDLPANRENLKSIPRILFPNQFDPFGLSKINPHIE